MTTIELPSGMTLPTGTRHAGLDRLTAGASLATRLLAGVIRTLEARRIRALASTRDGLPTDERGTRWSNDPLAGLPRVLGD